MPTRTRELLDTICSALVTSLSLVILLLCYWPYTRALNFRRALR